MQMIIIIIIICVRVRIDCILDVGAYLEGLAKSTAHSGFTIITH